MVKSPEMVVGEIPLSASIIMPAPRMVTAFVMLVAMKFPDDKVMTSPCAAALRAVENACAP